MAGNLPVPNGVELKLTWAVGGVLTALNVLHFNNPSGAAITQTVANSVSSAVSSAITGSGLLSLLHSQTGMASPQIRDMSANSHPWVAGTLVPIVPTGTGKQMPPANAVCVTLKTGLRGRSYNGRFYVFGFAEVANDTAGTFTAATDTAAAKFLNDLRTALAGGTPVLNLAILSRWTTPPGATAPIERQPPILTNVTTALCLDRRWDVQRRRAIPGI